MFGEEEDQEQEVALKEAIYRLEAKWDMLEAMAICFRAYVA